MVPFTAEVTLFSCPKRPHRVRGPASLLFNGYRGIRRPGREAGPELNQALRLRVRRPMPLLPLHSAPSGHAEGQPYLRQCENYTEGVGQQLSVQCAREPTRGLKACLSVCLSHDNDDNLCHCYCYCCCCLITTQ